MSQQTLQKNSVQALSKPQSDRWIAMQVTPEAIASVSTQIQSIEKPSLSCHTSFFICPIVNQEWRELPCARSATKLHDSCVFCPGARLSSV